MAASNNTPNHAVIDAILQCPLCLHQLETPVTLKQCLHTFCKECLDEIPQTTQDDITGWKCPRCGKFSSTEEVAQNDFLQKWLQARNSDGTDPVECKQCHGKTEVKWRCNDCGIELCTPCSVNHVNIPLLQSHVILPLKGDKASNPVIDELLFCHIHKGKLLELNCRMCEVPLCVLCKIEEHDTHTTETVSTALSRLVPEIEQRSETIAERVQHLETQVNSVRSTIEDTKQSYAVSRKKVHERIEYLVTELREIETEQEDILLQSEKETITRLEETKAELEARVEEAKQVLLMTSFTRDSAINVCLLQELQGGLLQKLRRSSKNQCQPLIINLLKQSLAVTVSKKQCKTELRDIFGTLKKQNLKHKTTRDGQLMKDHYLCEDFSTIMEKTSAKQDESVHLPFLTSRISLIYNSIYIPSLKGITVYDLESKITTRREVPFNPLIVKRLPNNQVAVGSQTGLYLYDSFEPDAEAFSLEDGGYSDIDVYGNIFHALKYNTSQIVSFRLDERGGFKNSRNMKQFAWMRDCIIQLACISRPYYCNTFCRSEDTFVVSSIEDKCVFLCDTHGVLLQRIISSHHSFICGIDMEENIIVANYSRKTIVKYNAKQHGAKENSTSPLQGNPRDVLLDNDQNMWVLVELGKNSFNLIKYGPKTP